VFQTPLGFSNVSAFSARSAVKLGGIVISLEKSIVPKIAVNANEFLPKATAPKLRAKKTDNTRPFIATTN